MSLRLCSRAPETTITLFGGICDQFSQANRRSTASSAYPGRVTTHLAAFALASAGGDPLRLATAVRAAPPLMQALRAARDVGAPDWLVCAGAIRDAVWDALHDRPPTALPRDVDLGFFDSRDLNAERDEAVEAALRARAPALPWEAKNQAAVHLWYPQRFGLAVPPFRSCAEAVATFPETAACVGVRLLVDDDMLVVAPHGLGDLLGCVCRHNPARVPPGVYERRVAEKGWRERWPRMRYVPSGA
jgi:uncharacterized protein